MPSKTRALLELTRIHLFPVGCELVFWPFGEMENDAAHLFIDCNS
jgi:hypothetical protein